MDITKMTKVELESLGYQQMKEKLRIEQNLILIEQQLDKFNNESFKKTVDNKK